MRTRLSRLVAAVGVWGVGQTSVLAQAGPCPAEKNCAEVRVGAPSGIFDGGDEVQVTIRFRQGADDGAPGGIDEVAALALSLSLPGLELVDCGDPDELGLTSAIAVGGAYEPFWVSVENTACVRRDGCLCPMEGQERDGFINVAVTGPKDLGSVTELPVLPSAELLSLTLRVSEDAPPGRHRLHVFAESDDPKDTPLPPFAAFLSLGDTNAEELRVDPKTGVSRVRIVDAEIETSGRVNTPTDTPAIEATATPTVPGGPTATPTIGGNGCTGDCGGDGSVTVDELVRGVAMALGVAAEDCPAFDCDGDEVTVSCLVRAVNAALHGCP